MSASKRSEGSRQPIPWGEPWGHTKRGLDDHRFARADKPTPPQKRPASWVNAGHGGEDLPAGQATQALLPASLASTSSVLTPAVLSPLPHLRSRLAPLAQSSSSSWRSRSDVLMEPEGYAPDVAGHPLAPRRARHGAPQFSHEHPCAFRRPPEAPRRPWGVWLFVCHDKIAVPQMPA